jgi:dihydroorotate dehydrogenase (NAD+) catalytic subunit
MKLPPKTDGDHLNRLKISLGDWCLENPIMPASGTFGFGHEFAQWYDINILGSIVLKSATKEPRIGNAQPRLAECRGGILNSIGLQNPGIKKVIGEEIPKLRRVYNKKIIASIAGSTVDEYVFSAGMFDDVTDIEILEINLSCPNVKAGGMTFGSNAKMVEDICRRIKNAVRKKIYIKLSPNVADITEIAKGAETGGADGLTLINTLLGMAVDSKTGAAMVSTKTAGYSGFAIKPVALRMIYQVFKSIKIPIIGCGGVTCADDVLEFLSVGASAVQIGTQNLIDPFVCESIINDLPKKMDEYGIKTLAEIVGRSH